MPIIAIASPRRSLPAYIGEICHVQIQPRKAGQRLNQVTDCIINIGIESWNIRGKCIVTTEYERRSRITECTAPKTQPNQNSSTFIRAALGQHQRRSIRIQRKSFRRIIAPICCVLIVR